jgi:hypothetical protein
VVAEEVKAGAHGREHFVDGGLAGILDPGQREGSRRLVGKEDIDARKAPAGIDLLLYKMAAPQCLEL